MRFEVQAEEALSELSNCARAYIVSRSEAREINDMIMQLNVLAISTGEGAATLARARADLLMLPGAPASKLELGSPLTPPLLGKLSLRNLSFKASLSSLGSFSPRIRAGSLTESPSSSQVRRETV